jgi:AcrR family transcriptional regulator
LRRPAPSWRTERYRRLLRATTELLQARPTEAVSMDDIARAAGVGKATLYRYFDSKQALLRACLDQVVDRLGARMEAAEATDAPAPDRLRAILGIMIEVFSSHLMPLRLLTRRQADLQEDWRNSVLEARQRLVGVLGRHFAAGAVDGSYRPVDGEMVPHMIMGMIRSSVTHIADRSGDEIADGVAAFVLRAVAADALPDGHAARDAMADRPGEGS